MAISIEKWDFYELELIHKSSSNPFTEIRLEADFTLDGQNVKVSGFYDGNDIFKIRFMPDVEGQWQFVTSSNVPALDGQTGDFLCVAPSDGNHGPVRVANTTHFAYADGTAYIPVGTTCYVWNHQGDELEEQTLKTLESAPFNKIRMSVFPKRYDYNHNEPPCYPFPGQVTKDWDPSMMFGFRSETPPDYWDFDHFNPEYFQHLEKRILDLRKRGIEADLILFHPYDFGAWGFDRLPREVNDRLLHYLIARLGAIRNVWWSFANEYDLFHGRTMEDWDHYMQFVQDFDPYNHLRSIHNCFSFYDHTKPWVTHCSIQHQDTSRVPAWRNKYNKPVIIDECGYEGDIQRRWGDLSAEELVLRYWMGYTLGGYVTHGETFINKEETLWWSKGGHLQGKSVARIEFMRGIFENAPELTPVEVRDTEDINFMEPQTRGKVFGGSGTSRNIDMNPTMAGWDCDAAGYNLDAGYFMFYYGMHQPGFKTLTLSSDKTFKVDLIDTWNMTIKTVDENAHGEIRVEMPNRKFMAIRIQRI